MWGCFEVLTIIFQCIFSSTRHACHVHGIPWVCTWVGNIYISRTHKRTLRNISNTFGRRTHAIKPSQSQLHFMLPMSGTWPQVVSNYGEMAIQEPLGSYGSSYVWARTFVSCLEGLGGKRKQWLHDFVDQVHTKFLVCVKMRGALC